MSGAPGRRTGRRPGSEDTRAAILAAARTAFGERGYEGASIRDIASRAGVDGALVHHYFGSKQRLFLAASEFPVDVSVVVPQILAGPPETMGERLVRAVVGIWDRPEVRPLLLGILRSATTDPIAAAMLRGLLTDGPIGAIARSIGGPNASARASLAGTQLVGLVLARYVVALEPVASMTPEELAAAIGPTIGRYLAGDVRLTTGEAPG